MLQTPRDRPYPIYRRFIVYIVVKLDHIGFFVSQPIGFFIALNTYIARGLFYVYVMCLHSILAVIESLLQYIRGDPPNILDYRSIINIYPDPLYPYSRVLNNILKAFLCSNSFSIKNI
jgi:hypothetical protein